MRKQISFIHSENMFGHTYAYELPDQAPVTVLENSEHAWHMNHKRINKPYYWFRAPQISQSQLSQTLKNLCDLGTPFELKVWHSDKGLDASLKISDELDASTWAWSHTEMWAKWSDDAEKSWKAEQKPRKVKVLKDGTVKVKVTVSQITDP